jgi:hypothetical protein
MYEYLKEIMWEGVVWIQLAQCSVQCWDLVNMVMVVGFDVFTAVVLKSIFFWDMTPCTL